MTVVYLPSLGEVSGMSQNGCLEQEQLTNVRSSRSLLTLHKDVKINTLSLSLSFPAVYDREWMCVLKVV